MKQNNEVNTKNNAENYFRQNVALVFLILSLLLVIAASTDITAQANAELSRRVSNNPSTITQEAQESIAWLTTQSPLLSNPEVISMIHDEVGRYGASAIQIDHRSPGRSRRRSSGSLLQVGDQVVAVTTAHGLLPTAENAVLNFTIGPDSDPLMTMSGSEVSELACDTANVWFDEKEDGYCVIPMEITQQIQDLLDNDLIPVYENVEVPISIGEDKTVVVRLDRFQETTFSVLLGKAWLSGMITATPLDELDRRNSTGWTCGMDSGTGAYPIVVEVEEEEDNEDVFTITALPLLIVLGSANKEAEIPDPNFPGYRDRTCHDNTLLVELSRIEDLVADSTE